MSKRSLLTTTFIVAVVLMSIIATNAQERKREYINAVAQGTSQQLGTIVRLNLIINEFSTQDDQKILVDAFQEKGSEGLANALHKMPSKGRISLTGTLGYDVNYIREFLLPDGTRKIRFVTDRAIRFGEAWTASRSMDYALSMGEITIIPDNDKEKRKSSGTVIPAAQFKIEDKELTVEAFRNPWKLVSVDVSK